MKKVYFAVFITLLFSFTLSPIPTLADGIVIPVPPPCDPCPPPPCPDPFHCPVPSPMTQLVIRYHRVTVDIQNQVAVTHVDQVFYNPNDWAVEGTYVFPLPKDAAISGFTLWVDGKPVEGQILEADEARRQYQEIVSSMRDPALLEYIDQGAFQAHVFPIPPNGERRIELEYSQVLAAEDGLVRYIYPLNTEKFSAWPLEQVSVSVDIRAQAPIRAVFSPSHTVDIMREGAAHVRAGYEDQDILPDSDFALYYSLGDNEAFHLINYRDPGVAQADGFFLLLLAPRMEAPTEQLAKDVILVLDRSGSMEGEKFHQAQDALKYVLGHLNAEDRFNVLAFSTVLETYAAEMRPAAESPQAGKWVDQLSAYGSTDINRALLEAASIAQDGRPTYVIFLTDGLPTEGVVESQQILDNLQTVATNNLRLFSFGVGYDVDTFLLDSLAQAHHGTSTYVLPDERLDETLSAFYAKISDPVLTGLELDFGEITVYDLYPSTLPDLFRGSQIVTVGRYRDGGRTDVILTGTINDQVKTINFPNQYFPAESTDQGITTRDTHSAIPRLWATRKIGHLLNQVRLNGPDQETIDQIVQLSIRYGVVTPYTSYLVTEPMPLGVEEQERIAREEYDMLQSTTTAPVYGEQAVQKAIDQSSMAEAEAPAPLISVNREHIRYVGSRTFVFTDNKWVDTAFDPDRMSTTQVVFLSEEYFALSTRHPELADAFALGPEVIALSDGVAYEIVPETENSSPAPISKQSSTPTPVVNLPMINKAGTPTPTDQPPGYGENLPPAPCIGGMLLVAAIPFSFLLRLRNSLHIK